MKMIFFTVITTLFLCQLAFSQQKVVSGLKIDKAVTWSGTIVVEGDVTVTKKGRLTIEAGTKVLFKPQMDKTNSGKDKTRSELIVKGSLVVKGQMESKVTFSSMAKNPKMGDWYGIYIGNPKQMSIIDYAIIEYGYNGIMIKKSNPVIRNSQINLNYNAGILCEVKSEAKITKNIISENGYGGIICGLGAKPVLSFNLISLNEIGIVVLSLSQPNLGSLRKDKNFNQGENNIFENTEYDIYNHTKLPLLAENNSWGNNRDLTSRIYDSGEDSQYGIVDVQPIFRQTNLDELILVAQNTNADLAESTEITEPENVPANDATSQPIAENSQSPAQQMPDSLTVSAINNSSPLANTPLTAINDNTVETNEDEIQIAQEIDPPAIAQAQSDRPLATSTRPQINFNQIFLEPLLDGGSTETIKKVRPRITKSGPKGRVIIRAVVGKDGKVENAKVVKGLNEYFDEVSLAAAERFEFSTGKVKGVPVKFYTNISFEF